MNSFKLNIEGKELIAAFELLLISVAFLNLFPNKGFSPWKAFNPYQIWLMVVLVATISFVAYFAMKLVGPKKGGLLRSIQLFYQRAHVSKKIINSGDIRCKFRVGKKDVPVHY